MKIEGDYLLKASPATLWEKLLDTETLAKITPGVKHLEETAPDQYIATSEIKIGPVQGSFKGDLSIKDKKEPEGFTLVLKQKSKIGNATAEVKLNILPQSGEETTVKYEGKAKLSGVLARTGQRVIGGVVKTLAKQFFKALEAELATGSSDDGASPTAGNASTTPAADTPPV
ncbi:MAG: carbon monoxide dehydrogenase subunit G [Saprospiraceae bacterium]|nr:carbon monoxide dehydrogenase subunit G [Saprospiraceae bacterium]